MAIVICILILIFQSSLFASADEDVVEKKCMSTLENPCKDAVECKSMAECTPPLPVELFAPVYPPPFDSLPMWGVAAACGSRVDVEKIMEMQAHSARNGIVDDWIPPCMREYLNNNGYRDVNLYTATPPEPSQIKNEQVLNYVVMSTCKVKVPTSLVKGGLTESDIQSDCDRNRHTDAILTIFQGCLQSLIILAVVASLYIVACATAAIVKK